MSTRPPWEVDDVGGDIPPWEVDDVEGMPEPPKPKVKPKALPQEKPTLGGVLSEVPGVLGDYATGAAKGVGRLARGFVQLDPFRPNAAIGMAADVFRKQKAEEIDQRLGLKAKGGVQEAGGAIPYLASTAQGGLANAAVAGVGSLLETMDPAEAAKSAALGGAAGKLAPLATKWGGKLMGSAVNQYEKALHPTTRAAKVDTARIVPELLKRRISGSLEDLTEMGTAKSNEFGQKIASAYSKSPKTVDATQIADDLERLKTPFIGKSSQGAPVVMDDAAVGRIDEIQSKLREFGSALPPEELWKYRQVLDRVVKASGGFTKELSKESAAEISRGARQAVQKELSKAVPNVQKLNAEYHLWESLQDIATETGIRKTGQQGLPGMLARGAGAVTGGAVGAMVGGPYAGVAGTVAGAQATKKVADLMATPAWRTTSAVTKARVADFLRRGDVQSALGFLTRAVTATAASSASPTRKSATRKRE